MYKIATHDSATGEQGKGFISWLLTPFAKTQSKTIKEQYDAGCRMFDIRIKKSNNEWHCAHGPWLSKRTLKSIIQEINAFPERCYVSITYEGKVDNNEEIITVFNRMKLVYRRIIWGALSVKYGKDSTGIKVKYDIVVNPQAKFEFGLQGFLPLDGRSWHTYLPIPWLWDRLYKRPHVFNEDTFTFVDFL